MLCFGNTTGLETPVSFSSTVLLEGGIIALAPPVMGFDSATVSAVAWVDGPCSRRRADTAFLRSDEVLAREDLAGVSACGGTAISSSSLVPFLDGAGIIAGVLGRSGNAGVTCDTCRLKLALLEGREVGREDEPSKSGRAVGLASPRGTVGVELLLSFAI